MNWTGIQIEKLIVYLSKVFKIVLKKYDVQVLNKNESFDLQCTIKLIIVCN